MIRTTLAAVMAATAQNDDQAKHIVAHRLDGVSVEVGWQPSCSVVIDGHCAAL